jgi:hypothetical protein
VPTDLRPLSLGELLDRAFTLYRRHLWLLVGIMAVPSVFGLILALMVAWFQRMMGLMATPEAPAPVPSATLLVTMLGLLAGIFVLVVATAIVHMIALGAITRAVSELYLDRLVTIGGVYRSLRGRFGALVLLLLLVMLRVGGLAFAGIVLLSIGSALSAVVSPFLSVALMLCGMFVVGGVCLFMLLRYGVAVPALVVEGLTARGAILRSIELTEGHRWRVLVLGICATIVSWAGIAVLQAPFIIASMIAGPETSRGFLLNLIGTATGTIGGTFTGPVMIVGLALLYYDTRVRHEALDLDVMIDALDRRAAQPPLGT